MGCFTWPPPPAALGLGDLCCTGPWGSQTHPDTDPASHTGCPRHSTALSSSHTGLTWNINTDSQDVFLLLGWKWLTFTSESTNSRFSGKHELMDPQLQHGPFYTLFQLFLSSLLPLHFSSYSSCRSTDALFSETLRFRFVSVAKSSFGCSFLMTCQGCFLLLSPLFLSIRFIPFSFVSCSPFYLLSPFALKRSLINDLKETDAHLPVTQRCFCITVEKMDPTEKHLLPLAKLELSPGLAWHWLFIRQEMKELVLHLGTRELGSSALCFQHISFISVEMKFSYETPVSLYSCYWIVQLSSDLLLIWKGNLFSATWAWTELASSTAAGRDSFIE